MNSQTKRLTSLAGRPLLAGALLLFTAALASPGISVAASKGGLGKGALWVANGTDVLEFGPANFVQPGIHGAKPRLILNSATGFGAPQGVVFDSGQNLWVIDGGTVAPGGTIAPELDQFTTTQLQDLKTTPTPAPNLALTSSAFVFPQQAVFDTTGNLWVSDNGANAVYVFTAAQLAAGGAQMPTVTITSTPAFTGPLGIAFDATGNLWIANNATTTIFEFNAASLPPPTTMTAVTLTPNVVLSDDGNNSIQGPWALVFDSAGNLWSSNANAPSTVVEFAKASLGATGSPTPTVTLSPTTERGDVTLAAPNGLAFSTPGGLAVVSSATPFGVALYGVHRLAKGGAVRPLSLVVNGNTTLNAPAGCNFGPFIWK